MTNSRNIRCLTPLLIEDEFSVNEKVLPSSFKLSMAFSFLFHVFLLLLYSYYSPINNSSNQQKSLPKLRTIILKHSESVADEALTEQLTIANTKPEIKPEPKQKEKIDQVTKPVKKSTQNKVLTSNENNRLPSETKLSNQIKSSAGSINYTTLSSSINDVIEQDSQTYNQLISDQCEKIKQSTGELDCISNLERLGYKKQDPYQLAKIFKALDKNPKGKKKQRQLARLMAKESNYSKILENKDLPDSLKILFKDEIAFLRGEIHYLDCDGKPNSGTCAGEIDIVKIGELIGLLFKD